MIYKIEQTFNKKVGKISESNNRNPVLPSNKKTILLIALPPSWINMPPLSIASLAGFLKPRWNLHCLDMNLELFSTSPEHYDVIQGQYWSYIPEMDPDNNYIYSRLSAYEDILLGKDTKAIPLSTYPVLPLA